MLYYPFKIFTLNKDFADIPTYNLHDFN